MVDFQTVTLFSLTLLTAAMFIFFYLLVNKGRHTPPVKRKIPQTPIKSPISISRTKIKDPTLTPIQIPTQASIQIKAPLEIPTQTQSQIPSQMPVQSVSQLSIQAPPENAINMSARVPILRGETAIEALKEFAEELEKGQGTSTMKTRDASLLRLARVLIDVIQADTTPKKITGQPDQNKQGVEREKKTVTEPHGKQNHSSEKKAEMHLKNRARTANRNRKAKNKKTKIKVKSYKRGRRAKNHSKQLRATKVHSKRGAESKTYKKSAR